MRLVIARNHILRKTARHAAVLCTAAGLAACVAPTPAPTVVEATQPTVTYNFTTDEGLVLVTQKAENYCREFRASPTSHGITDNQDGTRTVVFECTRTPPPAPVVESQSPANPSLTYTVRSQREFTHAIRDAQSHCEQKAMRADTLKVVRRDDGSRVMSFRCIPA